MPEPLIETKNIHKWFGTIHAVNGVDFKAFPEECVGLLGDNGAGKSTFIKIISGLLEEDEGEIFWKGEKVEINSVDKAKELNIETVHQNQLVIDSLDVASNIFLGREKKFDVGPFSFTDERRMRREAEKLTERLGLDIASPQQEVRFCSGGERQGVAIARAMYFDAEFVILDEPTTALSVRGVEKVLNFIRGLKDEGISSIFITHNLEHVFPVADRFMVLVEGEKVGDVEKENTTREELIKMQTEGSV